MCECHSYNMGVGDTPEVILYPADTSLTGGRGSVCVDACISDVISELWKQGLPTLNSCCGHSKEKPSLVIPENNVPSDYFSVLKSVDDRDWAIFRWELTKHSMTGD